MLMISIMSLSSFLRPSMSISSFLRPSIEERALSHLLLKKEPYLTPYFLYHIRVPIFP